jgi:hypothetical protein
VTAAHNAHFLSPVPAAIGIESEESYVRRNFAPAALFERARTRLPPHARVVAVNEVRLFRFPRPVSASRVLDPPLLRSFLGADARSDRAHARGRRHASPHRQASRRARHGAAAPRDERNIVRAVVRASRLGSWGDVALLNCVVAARSTTLGFDQ